MEPRAWTHFRLDPATRGLATLWIDVAGQRVNVLNRAVLTELGQVVEHLAGLPDLETVILRSPKPSGFLAGADLKEFARIRTAEEAEALSRLGQDVFQKLAELKAITVAVIHGPCLGGGLELALACDYRLAVDLPATRLALPEVELGLVPGWGGTQRLPRTIALEHALTMILTGKQLSAPEAAAWGLVDRAVSDGGVSGALDSFLSVHRGKARRPRRNLRHWLLEANPLGRRLVFRLAHRQLARKAPEDMPAPFEALKTIDLGLSQGMAAGLACERAANARLFTTSAASRCLIRLFFQREEARKVPAEAKDLPPLRRVGVVGAGTMGAGIAQLAAVKGCQVAVQEVNEQALAAGMKRIEELLAQAAARQVITPLEWEKIKAGLGRTTTWEGFDQVDLVVEAAVEELAAKQALFRELDRRTPPTAILATNTSSLSVAQLQEGLTHPGRVAALHFFNPVHKLPLVEIAHTPLTCPTTVAALRKWAIMAGKTPVVVKDSPGFVVNRILLPYFHEALLILLVDGVAAPKIDGPLRKFGMPMGPLELLDQIGLDVAAHVCRALDGAFGARFPQAATWLNDLVKAGLLGKKNGRGFYVYDAGGKARPNPQAQRVAGIQVEHYEPTYPRSQGVRDRLVAAMVNEAARCLEEGLAPDAATVDLAMVLGTGWAPHRGGPLSYADTVGLPAFVERLNVLRQEWGSRFQPCGELQRRAEAGRPFYGEDLP
jgi:3-hydroxyacyl-CoA dehydrogenase/enoyl-CoA hydratase/3-hydroxybutyryl-CoA epimerase